jgi:hypothetical protein
VKFLRNLLLVLFAASLLAGCGSLAPARKEFFQDKVERVPEATARERETEKQTVDLLRRRTQQTVVAAVLEKASPGVTEPAKDAAILADAVAVSVGPPKNALPDDSKTSEVANKLLAAVAKLDSRMESFREDVRDNEGRKIEGSGLFSVPYFVWLGGVLVLVFIGFTLLSVGWMALKAFAISNPPLAVGMGVANIGAKFAKSAFSQILQGGEEFKDAVGKKIADPAIAAKVLELFKVHQRQAQSPEVQAVIQELTK